MMDKDIGSFPDFLFRAKGRNNKESLLIILPFCPFLLKSPSKTYRETCNQKNGVF